MKSNMSIIKTDVLVIGGGGAAARAALEASEYGAEVTMVVKGVFGKSGATVYEVAQTAGFNAVDGCNSPENALETYYNDIIKAAQNLADEKLVRILVEESAEALRDLEKIGVEFEKENGEHYTKLGCFASTKRTHVIKNHGVPIVNSLKKEIIKRDVNILSNTMVTDLLVEDNTCFGAVGIDREGTIYKMLARTVILATGGAGQLYKYNLNPVDITGDGFALAYRAGAELINMEFIQYGLATIKPTYALIDKWTWSVYPDVYNREGVRFIEQYLPEGVSVKDSMEGKIHHMPFSTCDSSMYLEIAIEKEIIAGRGTENNGIYVSLQDIPVEELEKAEMWSFRYPWFLDRGIDLKNSTLEIGHFSHAFNGGVLINENTCSNIDSLYAIGEVAGGYCGADRLGGDMLTGCQVFGKRAGRSAALKAKTSPHNDKENIINKEIENIEKIYAKKGSVRPIELIRKLQETMQTNALIIRNEESLLTALKDIDVIEKEVENNISIETQSDIFKYFELRNMQDLTKIIVSAALERKETRGSHYREDFPNRSEKYNNPIIIKR